MPAGQVAVDLVQRLDGNVRAVTGRLAAQRPAEKVDLVRLVVLLAFGVECEDATSVAGHRFVKRPLVVDAERVDDAAVDGRGQLGWVQADGFLSVQSGPHSGAHHFPAEILDEGARGAIGPLDVLDNVRQVQHFGPDVVNLALVAGQETWAHVTGVLVAMTDS